MPKWNSRPGFTTVELLVVISIIAVLAGLLLPAVQSIREAARRVACQNNFRQSGIAIAHYESAFRHFPPGRIGCDDTVFTTESEECPSNLSVPQRNGASGFVELLPYLELQAIHDDLNVDNGGLWNRDVDDLGWYDDPDKKSGIKKHVSVFWCPSEDGNQMSSAYYPVWAATSTYAFSNGSLGPETAEWITKYQNNGAFVYRKSRCHRDLTDGLSETILMGEVTQPDTWESSNVWSYALANADCLRSTSNPLNTRPGDGVVLELRNGAFGSQHPSGGLFLFADGHIDFVGDQIDTSLYRALSTISGQESAERFN